MLKKIGIFGGTFNPIHFGHINSILSVKEKMNLDAVKVIPAHQAPGKELLEAPSAEERLALVELGLSEYYEDVFVDSCELERGGVSYSIDTIEDLKKESPDDEFYLIIGLDQFQSFDSWKNFENIFGFANLIVTSRPGFYFPLNTSDFPKGLEGKIEDFDGYVAMLENGAQIHFIRLNDQDVSSSDIRKRVRLNQSIHKYVPLEVENYIKEKSLYTVHESIKFDPEKLSEKISSILKNEGGINVVSFDLRGDNQITDFNFVASAQSKRATQSLAENLKDTIRDELGVKPIGMDGLSEGKWIVVDYGSIIVHLFYDYCRQEYALEKLWEKYPVKQY